MDNVPVNSPDVLRDIDSDELHLIICIKKYYGVVKQLKEMGIFSLSFLFDIQYIIKK